MINLAIIDSGLTQINNKVTQINIRIKNNKIIYPNNCINNPIHCNLVYKIINEESDVIRNNENEIKIFIFNILDQNLKTCFSLIDEAFKTILKLDIDLVNMSMGYKLENKTDYFKKIVKKLLNKKTFIISAASEFLSYPSVLKDVITVSDLNLFNKKNKIKDSENFDFIVDINSYNRSYIHTSTTSYAAPFVTAKAIDIMTNKKIGKINELKKELAKYFVKWE